MEYNNYNTMQSNPVLSYSVPFCSFQLRHSKAEQQEGSLANSIGLLISATSGLYVDCSV